MVEIVPNQPLPIVQNGYRGVCLIVEGTFTGLVLLVGFLTLLASVGLLLHTLRSMWTTWKNGC